MPMWTIVPATKVPLSIAADLAGGGQHCLENYTKVLMTIVAIYCNNDYDDSKNDDSDNDYDNGNDLSNNYIFSVTRRSGSDVRYSLTTDS